MMISGMELFYFRLPLAVPVRVGERQQLDFREGFLLALTDGEGHTGYGEIAPLPGLDSISLAACRRQLREIRRAMTGKRLEAPLPDWPSAVSKSWAAGMALHPVVSFGLESALAWLAVHRAGGEIFPFSDGELRVAVNGLFMPGGSPGADRNQMERLRAGGFGTIKVKIGRLSLEPEAAAIDALCGYLKKDVRLRLDGNRSLGPDQYRQYYRRLSHLTVEYVEEPLTGGDFTAAAEVPWPLAVDESLPLYCGDGSAGFQNVPPAVTHLILKPGAPAGLIRQLAREKKFRFSIVFSSAFNSGVGIVALMLLAAVLPPARRVAHGLDTRACLAADLLTMEPQLEAGHLALPASFFKGMAPLNTGKLQAVTL